MGDAYGTSADVSGFRKGNGRNEILLLSDCESQRRRDSSGTTSSQLRRKREVTLCAGAGRHDAFAGTLLEEDDEEQEKNNLSRDSPSEATARRSFEHPHKGCTSTLPTMAITRSR